MEKNNQTVVHKRDVYEIINERVIAQLEKGIIPWKKTWTSAGPPSNFVTQKLYKGVNIWLLSSLGYDLNCFLTFKQVKELGGSIIKGEHATPIVYWNWPERGENEDENTRIKPILRYYMVYNISQCENLPASRIPFVTRPNNPINVCEKIVVQMPKCPKIVFGDDAFYHTVEDYISIPKMGKFNSSEEYYNTLFHEMIHSTGHQTRLNRKEITNNAEFGSMIYSIEELTAEMGACHLKSLAGFDSPVVENNISYIQNWLINLKADRKLLIYAGSQAQKAVDFIINATSTPITEKKAQVSQ